MKEKFRYPSGALSQLVLSDQEWTATNPLHRQDWAFVHGSQAGITATAVLVLVYLAMRWHPSSGAFPSIPTIVDHTGAKSTSVREGIKALKAAGLLVTERRHRPNGSRTSNLYKLAFEITDIQAETKSRNPALGEKPSAGIRPPQAPESEPLPLRNPNPHNFSNNKEEITRRAREHDLPNKPDIGPAEPDKEAQRKHESDLAFFMTQPSQEPKTWWEEERVAAGGSA